jgi:hypothetical protein
MTSDPKSVRPPTVAATLLLAALGGLTSLADAASPPVAATEWAPVAKSETQQAFVDPASRRERDGYVEAAVRYDYATPQPYGRRTFLSARNVYRFDCAGARIADRENVVYAEPELRGRKVGDATRSTKNLIWRAVTPQTVDGAVLHYVCARRGSSAGEPGTLPQTTAPLPPSSGAPPPRTPPARTTTAPATGVPPPFKP